MPASPSRRSFLKSSSATVAAGVAAAHLVQQHVAYAAGSDTLKLGMIGCGGRCAGAAVDAMTADPGTKLVAMCDLFEDRAQAKLKAIQQQKPTQTAVAPDLCLAGLDAYKRVIDAADVVLIANAAKFHPFHLRAAIDAGRHVFLEKPHAIDPVGCRAVTAACDLARQKKLSVLSGLHSRYDLGIAETIQRVMDGAIGDIISIEENFIRTPYGNLHRDPKLSEIQYQYSNQYRFGWLCGDDVTQSLVHNLDRATWALKEAAPLKCHGLGGRSSSVGVIYGDVFDHHSVVYHYPNGVRLYAFSRTQHNCYNEDSSIILGSKGVAYPKSARITGATNWKYEGPRPNPYVREHEVFLKAIRAGQPLNCGDYMARSTLVAVMGQLSCYSGKEITWEQASTSDFAFKPLPEQCTWTMDPPVQPNDKGIYPVPVPGQTKTV